MPTMTAYRWQLSIHPVPGDDRLAMAGDRRRRPRSHLGNHALKEIVT